VFGMLPKHKLGNKIRKKLFVYADNIHKHKAQNPENLEVELKVMIKVCSCHCLSASKFLERRDQCSHNTV
ncbi:MAG: hypothetical protein Q8832_02655, partial [Candidatus Phytoplasma australasiaticum]|nr:hypothetical protein [Candidatus Phytoplasma australasiaticum]